MDIYASDDEKAEEIKRWWRENGRTVIIGLILGFASIFGVRAWMSYQQNQVMQASLIYQQVMTSLSDGDLEQASVATDGLIQQYSDSVYSVLSALQLASETKDTEQTRQYLTWVMEHATLTAHQELARLRLARIATGNGESEQALALIAESQAQAYQSLFAELEGDIYKSNGDKASAVSAYQRAIQTAELGGARQTLLQMKLDDVAVANEG